jgi:hypothetical protein
MKTIQLCEREVRPLETTEISARWRALKRLFGSTDAVVFRKPPMDTTICHEGFLSYLAMAWENHYSAVLRPDDLWYVIVCEIARVVRGDPKCYAGLFTKTPDAQAEIIVGTADVEAIDPYKLISALRKAVPNPLVVEMFLPDFTTATHDSQLALNIAFCDVVSPYYRYGTLLCGIPNIRVDGIYEDWVLLRQSIKDVAGVFEKLNPRIVAWLTKCRARVDKIIDAAFDGKADAKELFSQMVRLHHCGSGHQFEMTGWVLEFLYNSKQKIQLEGLPSHISRLDYKNHDTGRMFTLFTGCFYSQISPMVGDAIWLTPEYGRCTVEHKYRQTDHEEWEPGFYKAGSTVTKGNRVYKALVDAKTEPWTSEGEKEWECIGESKRPTGLILVSAPLVAKTKKLKATWTAEDDQSSAMRWVLSMPHIR